MFTAKQLRHGSLENSAIHALVVALWGFGTWNPLYLAYVKLAYRVLATPRTATAAAAMRCTNCGSLAIDFADSQAVCSACGVVLEESQIVSDITFAENTAGGAVVQGSYLGADQGT